MLPGMKLIEEYARMEMKFARHFYNGDMPDRIRQHAGRGRYLLAAPHSSNRMIDGRPRGADRYTGAMAQMLATKAGQSWLAADGVISEWTAWENRHDRFRKALDAGLDLHQFVIDLRAAPQDAKADIFIGFSPRPSEAAMGLAEAIGDAFPDFRVVAGGRFNPPSPQTIRSYIQSRGGDGIQLNVAPTLRDPEEHPDAAELLITRLTELLKTRP